MPARGFQGLVSGAAPCGRRAKPFQKPPRPCVIDIPPRPRHAPRLHGVRAIRRPISMVPGTRHAARAIRGLISMVPGTRHAAMLSALTQARNLSPIHAPCFGDALAPFEPSPFLIIIAARPMAGYAWGKREELCR
jgi:hypothetical protein